MVGIAGATGFVGKSIIDRLAGRYRIVGLTRSPTRAAQRDDRVEWRHCDLFSLRQVERALEGVDFAIYLVHSMLPTARLTQADFVDLDLLLADNFARAAAKNGVQQIVYLGGIRPDGATMSRHLQSRLEVEEALAGRSVPTTALRAGLVVGPGGSSMTVLLKLVKRLPVMVLPSWTRSKSAPIAIRDVVRAVDRCLGDPDTYGRHFELGGPETITYREMMDRAAQRLGVTRRMIPTPFFSPGLSTHWVSLITGAPTELVGPLIESLEHSVVPEDNWLNDWLQETGTTSFDEAVDASLDAEGRPHANPRRAMVRSDVKRIKEARTVRSVQRLPLPPGRDATWTAESYMRWLPVFLWPLLRVVVEGPTVEFRVRLFGLVLLRLRHSSDDSNSDRELLFITGGALAHVDDTYCGRLEFREALNRTAIIAAIHDFRPTLPWYIYNLTQAQAHLLVMRAFGWHLARTDDRRVSGVPRET